MNRKRLAKQPNDSLHPIRKYGVGKILDLETKFSKNLLEADEFSQLMEIYQVDCDEKDFVEYYDIKEDPIIDLYVEKIKQVADNQRFQKVMKQLTTAKLKGGYRFGAPKTPFGQLLQSMRVKLKPVDKKDRFDREVGNLKDRNVHDQAIGRLIRRLNRRIDVICPLIYEEMKKEEADLEERLERRNAQKVLKEVQIQLGEFDFSQTIMPSRDSSPLLKRLSLVANR